MIHAGAVQLPLRHLSVRVPWHDTDWTGQVCQCPSANLCCSVLKNIRENRDEERETELAGRPFSELDEADIPPCLSERGAFMATQALVRHITHPYARPDSKSHGHFAPTPYRYPAYSTPCIPFSWTLKESALEKVAALNIGFGDEAEDQAQAAMGFGASWVQTRGNQLALLDTFFSAIQPEESLFFAYAKRTPLVEDSRRVVIGVGMVEHVGDATEYDYTADGPVQAVMWERAVQHSIRPDMHKGFLFPYHQVLAYLEEHPEEDPTDYIAFVPDEQFYAFSYVSEHVTNDGAIATLLACVKALQNIKKIIEGPWDAVLDWLDQRINHLWAMRGPCPGLGSALTAFGVPQGSLAAYSIERAIADSGSDDLDPWPIVDGLLRKPATAKEDFGLMLGDSLRLKWKHLPDERRALLKLLSRFDLTAEQATRYYVHEDDARRKQGIEVTDAELLANPYLLYELDWMAIDAIQLGTIDRGLFPDDVVRSQYPLAPPSLVDDPTNLRRVRAFVVDELRRAADEGHTLQPRVDIVSHIRESAVQPKCPVDSDMMNVVEAELDPMVTMVKMADGTPAYKLARLDETSTTIRKTVLARIKGRRHEADIDWATLVNSHFGELQPDDTEDERQARQEKAAALAEVYASRVSVLIGAAGTGKTSVLQMLCHQEDVEAGGILLLAPTGKARVRMETLSGMSGAQTIAQFLNGCGRYHAETGTYLVSNENKVGGGRTIIIDEASMLTEPALAALLSALQNVDRLVLVGDPRQLPPIGAGRPFLDIVRQLEPDGIEAAFPRVGPGYAELTVSRRQRGEERDDLLLASWFSGRSVDAGADEIWGRLASGVSGEHLRFERWDSPSELPDLLLGCLVDELGLESKEDWIGFEESLGAVKSNGYTYYNATGKRGPGASIHAEDWQILSPMRNYESGVDAVNHLIKATFRKRALELATQQRGRKTPPPTGPDGILYGDKVINLNNHRHYKVWPETYGGLPASKYVANGEIGMVVGHFRRGRSNDAHYRNNLEIEFSSQPGFSYTFYPSQFSDDANPPLELAYALTVHKAQGSEFKLTLVVLPNPCRLLQRELLYTALTRHQNRVVVLHQGDIHGLKAYADDYRSQAAGRLTDLFGPASPVQHRERFLEEHLIHRTARGELVRSKSEVIICNMLYAKDIDYIYEAPLKGPKGWPRYPDFTIIDDNSGQTIYWEHLGMLKRRDYRERWERKLAWYRKMGVLPFEEGGGPKGTLVTTRDDFAGGIDSAAIADLIERVLET